VGLKVPYGNYGFAFLPASFSGGDGFVQSWDGLRGLNPEQSSRSHTSPSQNQALHSAIGLTPTILEDHTNDFLINAAALGDFWRSV